MFAIAVAVFFSALAIGAMVTIATSLQQAWVHGQGIMAELAELERSGRGSVVIALPPLRPRAGGTERVAPPRNKPVTLRPLRRPCAAA